MPQIYVYPPGDRTLEAVSDTNPFPVQVKNDADSPSYTTSKVYRTSPVEVPGIGTGAAYASGDAFGTSWEVVVPVEGTITDVVFLDLDDEGIQKDFVLFDAPFTETSDNSAFDVNDVDLLKCVGFISLTDFVDFNSNQVGRASPALSYRAAGGKLHGQIVTRGADNIAADNIPRFFLVIV